MFQDTETNNNKPQKNRKNKSIASSDDFIFTTSSEFRRGLATAMFNYYNKFDSIIFYFLILRHFSRTSSNGVHPFT